MPDDIPTSEEKLLAQAEGVRHLVRGLVRSDHVEDVVQETMLALVSKAGPARSSTGAWLSGVARNVVGKLLRTESRRLAREARAARPERLEAAAEVAERIEEQRVVVRCLRDLEEPYRTVVYLRYYDNLPPRHIAERLGIPVETVKSRLKRGLARLRKCLDSAHGGDGRSWRRSLIPLLFAVPHRAPGGVPRPAARIGAVVGAGLVLTALVVGIWQAAAPREPDGQSVPRVSQLPAEAPPGASGEATRNESGRQSRKDDDVTIEPRTKDSTDNPSALPPAVRADPRRPSVLPPKGAEGSSGGAVPTGLTERFLPEPPTGPAALLVAVQDRDGIPVPGAVVFLGTPGATGRRDAPIGLFRRLGETDAKGQLRCPELPAGAATVAANLGELLTQRGRRALDARTGVQVALADGSETRAEVRLPFALSELGKIRGRVSAPDGFPLRLVQLSVGLHGVRADAAGVFEIPWVRPGRKTLAAYATGMRRLELEIEVSVGDPTDVPVRLDFAASGELELSGVVVGPDGTPVPGAGIILYARSGYGRIANRSVRADENGRFVFERLPNELDSAEIRLSATRRGYRAGQAVLPNGIGRGEVQLRLPVRLVRVLIEVRDISTYRPVTSCRFAARKVGAATPSVQFIRRSDDGRYELWLAPGEHEFVIESPDHETHRCAVDVGPVGGEFKYLAGLTATRKAGPEVRLLVVLTSTGTGQPVERARVEVLPEKEAEARVSIHGRRSEGKYLLPVPAGSWLLRVTASGFERWEKRIQLSADEPDHRVDVGLKSN